MPALAVVGSDHQIIRSTETFRRKYENSVALCESSPELDLVLRGETDNAMLDLGGFSLAIEAVTDATGKRQAMLSLPAEHLGADSDAPLAALREAADESAAIVWAKDLDGRYLYANARYERELDTSEERLLGNTDADLPPAETVDGPRLRYAEDGLEEPLQLEYNVPAVDSRPPMVAFRFPLRDSEGRPLGTCGVAAPSMGSQVAREEAVRLMQLERWNRLDPLDVRAELLAQWHVQATPGPVEQLEPRADAVAVPVPVAQLIPPGAGDEAQARISAAEAEAQKAHREADQARAAEQLATEESARLRIELEAAVARAESLRAPADAALRLSEELGRALAAEQERGAELARALGRIRVRLGDLDSAVERSEGS